MSRPVWEKDNEGDYVAEFHGYSIVVTIGTQGDFYGTIFYGKDYWSDDVHEFNVGTYRSLPEAMQASEEVVLKWRREELATDDAWGTAAADVDG